MYRSVRDRAGFIPKQEAPQKISVEQPILCINSCGEISKREMQSGRRIVICPVCGARNEVVITQQTY